MDNVCIYARVSTGSQELEQQTEACRRYCEYKKFNVVKVYEDFGSGKSYRSRPGFVDMLKDIRAMKYDSVVVFRLDRLFRNVVEAVNMIQEWDNKGVRIHSINENLDTSTAIGKAMRDIILVLAQLERENIAEATRARLQALKDSGKKLGRPTISDFQQEQIMRYYQRGWSYRKIADKMRVKKSTVCKYVNKVKK